MTLNALYPFTGTILLIGIFAIQYGIVSNSFLIFAEGLFLFWLGIRTTFSVWEGRRFDT